MGQSIIRRDTKFNQGPATSGGGTYVVTLLTSGTPFTDQTIRVRVTVFLTSATASHENNGASYLAECVLNNKNNTVTFPAAIATSSNPINSNTVGFELTSRVEASDTAFNTSTVVLTISANNLVITVTNNGSSGSVNANVTVILDIDQVGST